MGSQGNSAEQDKCFSLLSGSRSPETCGSLRVGGVCWGGSRWAESLLPPPAPQASPRGSISLSQRSFSGLGYA